MEGVQKLQGLTEFHFVPSDKGRYIFVLKSNINNVAVGFLMFLELAIKPRS